jgi:hypothetical protein
VETGGGSLAAKHSDLAASEFNFLWENKNKDSRNRSTLALSDLEKEFDLQRDRDDHLGGGKIPDTSSGRL